MAAAVMVAWTCVKYSSTVRASGVTSAS